MAPRLRAAQHVQIADMIRSHVLIVEIADAIPCTQAAVRRVRTNLQCFGTTTAPKIRTGRPKTLTPSMLTGLLEELKENPEMFLGEMAAFLKNEYGVDVAISTISSALTSVGWSKKTVRRVVQERNADLCDYYLHYPGWRASLQNFQGSTDATVFEDSIEQLLHHCGRYPEPKSVLVMDNASFHRSERIDQLCAAAGVKFLYLSPYTPISNPIEEFFAELKSFINRHWQHSKDAHDEDFGSFLEWAVDVVGSRQSSARGHFRHAGIAVLDL